MSNTRNLERITAFFSDIGLPWRWQEGASGFIEHVEIADGGLLIDRRARPSGVLHEGGHLAVLPGCFRRLAQRNVSGVCKLMLDRIDFSDPDGPLQRAALQCSDPEATAWAWAAGVHLGLAPEVIIQDDEYDGSGSGERLGLRLCKHPGIHGLSHAGFCAIRPGQLATARGLPAFPKLKYWLQQDFSRASRCV